MSNIITLHPVCSRAGRYLRLEKRTYWYWECYHPLKGFLCQLVSLPSGFRVRRASAWCQHLAGMDFKMPQDFEREFLRAERLALTRLETIRGLFNGKS